VCNSHDTFPKVHESSRITQEVVCPRKDQVEVPSETLPFFHKGIGKIFEFIFQVQIPLNLLFFGLHLSKNFDIKKIKIKHSSTEEVSSPMN
jgi:hypothetical protein